MTKREFIIQYVLTRASILPAGVISSVLVNEAIAVWDNIIKACK